jgi:hypothetical protein
MLHKTHNFSLTAIAGHRFWNIPFLILLSCSILFCHRVWLGLHNIKMDSLNIALADERGKRFIGMYLVCVVRSNIFQFFVSIARMYFVLTGLGSLRNNLNDIYVFRCRC